MKPALPPVPRLGAADVPARLEEIDRGRRHAALATLSQGQPYVSLVAFALEPGVGGVLFAPPRALRKYRNLRENPRVSLLLDTGGEDDEAHGEAEAVTVVGRAMRLRAGTADRRAAAEVLLLKHPALPGFACAPTTAMVRVATEDAFHVGGFQRVTVWRPQGPASRPDRAPS